MNPSTMSPSLYSGATTEMKQSEVAMSGIPLLSVQCMLKFDDIVYVVDLSPHQASQVGKPAILSKQNGAAVIHLALGENRLNFPNGIDIAALSQAGHVPADVPDHMRIIGFLCRYF